MNVHCNQIQRSFLAAVVIAALLIGFAGMQGVQAQTPTVQTLQVANWTTPVTLANVTGRPTVINDGTTYHMWYTVTRGGDLLYTSFTDPASVPAGTAVTGLVSGYQNSPAVVKDSETFSMVNYTDSTEKSFSLYTSADGIAWTQGSVIFAGAGLPEDFQKIDAPSLIQDTSDWKLYFQVSAADGTYSIYAATSATLDGPYTLTNGTNPILTPGASGAWDTDMLQHPMVVKDGVNYYMWYVGYPNGGTQHLGLAFSSDGITWTKGAGNPILSDRAAEPSILKVGNAWHLWYLAEGVDTKYISASGPFQFSTIQAAVDAASAADTIQVAHGDYPEHVSITKPVTLLGPNSEINPITGTRTSEAVVTSFSTPYSTSLSGVTISGFKLTGSASPDLAAIYLGTTSNVILRNNLIEDVAVHGIAHFDNSVDNIVIENNKIVNVGLAGSTYTGMYLGKFTNSAIRNNLIDTTTYAGINLINSTNTDIEGNTVLHTYAQGIQVSDASGNIQVFGNTIDDAGNGTQEADKGGIRLYGTAVTNPIQVYENVVTHSFVGVSIRTGENIVGKNIRLYGNSIDATNTTQVYNGGTGTMNASGNWWGSNDATVFTTKMGGQVDYSPWLNVATDTDSAKPGFQGDFSYLNVDDDSPQSGTTHPVQEGIDLAAEGGTVNVLDGTYYGAILVDKPLTVKSQNGAANTILHGGLATPAIYVATIRAGNVTLDGFTITDPLYNSHSADVTGIMIGYYGDNNLTNIHIINNIVTEIGADDRVLDNMDDYPSVGIALNAVVDGLEIANNTIHDIHQTVSSADITWGPSAIGVYGYDVTPLSTNVTVHDNEIYNIAATNTNGANAIANGIRFGWGSGDGSIANNILHDIAGRGIHITVSNNGTVDITANEVHDCSLVGIEIDNPGSGTLSSNDIYQNGTGIAIGAEVNAPVIAHFNRIVDNTTGIDKTAAIALNAENNWWGCNAGPNATDCDTFTTADVSTVDADPWLVLTFTADQVKMTPGGLINLTAKLSINSDGVDTSVEGNVPDGIPVDFSATYGDLDLASSNLIGAQATNGLTLPDPITVNTATVSATVDHETADVTFGYMRYIFLPLINR